MCIYMCKHLCVCVTIFELWFNLFSCPMLWDFSATSGPSWQYAVCTNREVIFPPFTWESTWLWQLKEAVEIQDTALLFDCRPLVENSDSQGNWQKQKSENNFATACATNNTWRTLRENRACASKDKVTERVGSGSKSL